MSEERQKRPDREASDPGKPPAPGDQVPPGTEGGAENVCPRCGGSGRLENGERCPTCNGRGVVIEPLAGGG
ncbi:MAG: hypothetical protein AB1425_00205 [Actinomycetota bacterium]